MYWLYCILLFRWNVCETVGLKDKFITRRKEQAVVEKVGDILVDCVRFLFPDVVLITVCNVHLCCKLNTFVLYEKYYYFLSNFFKSMFLHFSRFLSYGLWRRYFGLTWYCNIPKLARTGGKPDIRPEWKRQRGRPCQTWVQQIEDDTGLNANDAWRIARDRKSWRALRPVAGQAFHWLTDCNVAVLCRVAKVIDVLILDTPIVCHIDA